MSTRRRYDRQFKIDAVNLWKTSGKSMADVARELGIVPNRIYRWKDELRIDEGAASPANGKSRDEEMERLRKEHAEMKMERDILKSLGHFLKHDGKYTNS